MAEAQSWVPLLIGLFGSGTIAALARAYIGRSKVSAEAESIRIGTLDHIVQTLSRRVDDLTKEVGRLEGRLDRTEAERDWWRERCHQLEGYIRDVANLPVPHQVPPIEGPVT